MDANQFIRQCNTKTLDDLAPYQGQWVAWSEDGQQILANAANLEELYQQIDRKGLTGYVIDCIPLADEDFLGGAVL